MSKTTIPTLQKKKRDGEKITMLTAYDASFSRILDGAGVDAILVGDSLGMVIQGRADTLSVTMDEMVYHTSIVTRMAQTAFVIGDMPFMSYQTSVEEALHNAGRLMKEGRAGCVKLEGGVEMAETVRRIVAAGIPVMGHIGLRPQSVHQFGGFRVQGRDEAGAQRLREDARALEEAGAWGIVLEGVPAALAEEISRSLTVPTVGIGAGAGCDGQVLVIYDLLGMDNSFNPKFAKKYANLHGLIETAVRDYIREVSEGTFPGEENSFK